MFAQDGDQVRYAWRDVLSHKVLDLWRYPVLRAGVGHHAYLDGIDVVIGHHVMATQAKRIRQVLDNDIARIIRQACDPLHAVTHMHSPIIEQQVLGIDEVELARLVRGAAVSNALAEEIEFLMGQPAGWMDRPKQIEPA